MDHARFDDLARAFGHHASRRAALRLLAAGALGGVAGLLGLDGVAARCRSAGAPCTKDRTCCSRKCVRGKCACTKTAHCKGGKVCRKGRCACDPAAACGWACPCPGGQVCDQGTCVDLCDASKCEVPHLNNDTGEWVCVDSCTGPGNECVNGTCGCPPEGCSGGQACIDGQCTDLCDPDKCQEPHWDPNSQQWVCLICQGNGGYCIGNDCSNAVPGSCINGHCGCGDPAARDYSCGWHECCPQDDPNCGCADPQAVELCCGMGSTVTCCEDWYCQFGCGAQNAP